MFDKLIYEVSKTAEDENLEATVMCVMLPNRLEEVMREIREDEICVDIVESVTEDNGKDTVCEIVTGLMLSIKLEAIAEIGEDDNCDKIVVENITGSLLSNVLENEIGEVAEADFWKDTVR